MKIEELITLGNKTLHKDQTKLLISTLLNMNPLELTFHLDKIVDDDIVSKFKDCIFNIQNGLPIQYALKTTNFYGNDFYVDNRVLIPRFETEELVYYTNLYIKKYFDLNVKVLDLCTGSGCIGLSLKKLNPNIKVTLSDISKDALEVTKINQRQLNLDANIVESDLFDNINDKFDVIVSNPPYVSYEDEVDEIVLKNEPNIALYAPNHGLACYENILKLCEKYLKNKYLIAFEIGSSQRDSVINLINTYLKDVRIICKQDMQKRDRMIFIFKNIEINE